jgi:hypothetical protein
LTWARKLAALSAVIGLLCSILGERVALGLPDAKLIPGLLDLRHTWNQGVSFSLLWQSGDSGRHALSLALLVLIVFCRRPGLARHGKIGGGRLWPCGRRRGGEFIGSQPLWRGVRLFVAASGRDAALRIQCRRCHDFAGRRATGGGYGTV